MIVVNDASPLTARARDELTTRRSARAFAGVAPFVARQIDRCRHAHDGVSKTEVQRRFEVRATLRALATSATKETAKDVT